MYVAESPRLRAKLEPSSKRNPCPSCGRTKDGDCRFNDELILCHQGSSHAPPLGLRVGGVVSIGGRPWALVNQSGGFDGAAAVFVPHRENYRPTVKSSAERKRHATELHTRTTLFKSLVRSFLQQADEALAVPEFIWSPPDQLRCNFALIEQAEKEGQQLLKAMQPICRENPDLRPIKALIDMALQQLGYQRRDVERFRLNYLGEVKQ